MSVRALIVILLIALVPVRAIGAVSITICASGEAQDSHQQGAATGSHAPHEGHSHATEGESASDSGPLCGNCAAHCAGVAFLSPAETYRGLAQVPAAAIPFGGHALPAVVLDRLDRPPLFS